jgi:hypothetical protein
MAERPTTEETRAGEVERSPMTAEQFEASPEFRAFKRVMKKAMKVSKPELDERVRLAKETSPRANNPSAPGRKRKAAPHATPS